MFWVPIYCPSHRPRSTALREVAVLKDLSVLWLCLDQPTQTWEGARSSGIAEDTSDQLRATLDHTRTFRPLLLFREACCLQHVQELDSEYVVKLFEASKVLFAAGKR